MSDHFNWNTHLDLAHKSKAEFVDIKETISGDIYIGCVETTAIQYIAHIAKQMQKNIPVYIFTFIVVMPNM